MFAGVLFNTLGWSVVNVFILGGWRPARRRMMNLKKLIGYSQPHVA